MKYIKEYKSYNNYIISTWEDNFDKPSNDVDYQTFIVDLEYNGDTKEVSIPYELLFNYMDKESKELSKYLSKLNLDGPGIFKDLESIGVDIREWLLKYCEDTIPKETYNDLPSL